MPVNAGIRDADSSLESLWTFRWDLLIAFVYIRLNHNTDDSRLAFTELVANCLCYFGLVLVIFKRVTWEILATDVRLVDNEDHYHASNQSS